MTVEYAIIATVSYVLGILTGIFLKEKIGDDKNKLIENNTFVLIIVTTVWAASMVFDMLSPEYTTNPMVHGLMGAIVGFFYRAPKKESNDTEKS